MDTYTYWNMAMVDGVDQGVPLGVKIKGNLMFNCNERFILLQKEWKAITWRRKYRRKTTRLDIFGEKK